MKEEITFILFNRYLNQSWDIPNYFHPLPPPRQEKILPTLQSPWRKIQVFKKEKYSFFQL